LERAETFGEDSPWAGQLPALLTLLDGLARHAVEDTNSVSLGCLGHLGDIESRVAAADRDTEAYLDRPGDIDKLRGKHDEDRRALDAALGETRTHAGDRDHGFAIIARNIRKPSGDTQAITNRPRPLVHQVHSELGPHGIEGGSNVGGGRRAEISGKRSDQDDLPRFEHFEATARMFPSPAAP